MAEEAQKAFEARSGFTSEQFKIEIQGIPRFFNVAEAKKLLIRKLGLAPHKIKPCGPGAKYMFVNFANEDDRDKAITALDGYKLKGKSLKAFKAKPAKDPLVKLHEVQAEPVHPSDETPASTLSPDERLIQAVCPLAPLPYEEQLRIKTDLVQEVMAKLRKEFMAQNAFLAKHGINNEDVARVQPFIPSPVTSGYRNKCEFSFGSHPETRQVTVGFRLASYKKGCLEVVGVQHLPIVSDKMKRMVQRFESFVRKSNLEPFDSVSQRGYWKQLTLRTSRSEEMLMMVILHPQQLSDIQKDKLKQDLIDEFTVKQKEEDPEDVVVSSLHIQFQGQRAKNENEAAVECISGSASITETLMARRLRFAISPKAFFQVNTETAEKLFDIVAELCSMHDSNTTVVDVCCGTGTIALCLADKCRKVIGVDCERQAIVDARNNAQNNAITNATFHADRAENVLSSLLRAAASNNPEEDTSAGQIVAVVDPPRAGLHPRAILALRSCAAITKLVYISCDANSALQNFINLGRMPSKQYPGNPFIPKTVIPVDLFPHTKHFELILIFERFPLLQIAADTQP